MVWRVLAYQCVRERVGDSDITIVIWVSVFLNVESKSVWESIGISDEWVLQHSLLCILNVATPTDAVYWESWNWSKNDRLFIVR